MIFWREPPDLTDLKPIRPLSEHPRWDVWYKERKISELIRKVNILIELVSRVPVANPTLNFLMEVEPMEQAIEKAVKLLAEKITGDVKSEDALRFTQAALNLEHVLAVKTDIELRKK